MCLLDQFNGTAQQEESHRPGSVAVLQSLKLMAERSARMQKEAAPAHVRNAL